MTSNMPTGAKKHRENTEPESHQMAKCFSFFFFFLFRQASSNCVTLSQWFSHKTAAFWPDQCTSPLLFHNLEVSRGGSNQSLKNYGFISDAIFKNWCMRTNHLATKQLLFKIVELEIRLCARRQGEPLAFIADSVCLKKAWSTILQPILHTSREETCEDRLVALW